MSTTWCQGTGGFLKASSSNPDVRSLKVALGQRDTTYSLSLVILVTAICELVTYTPICFS